MAYKDLPSAFSTITQVWLTNISYRNAFVFKFIDSPCYLTFTNAVTVFSNMVVTYWGDAKLIVIVEVNTVSLTGI